MSASDPRRLAQVVWPVALLVAVVCGFFAYITAFGVDVPYWDDWELLDRFHRAFDGNYPLGELIREKHNEHLVAVGFAYMLLHHLVTGFDVKAILVTDGLLQVASLAIVLRFAWRTMDPSLPRLWLLLPPAVCLLSFTQYLNLLWGFQTPWFLIALALVSSLAALDHAYRAERPGARERWTWAAALAAFSASFCSFHGLLVWVAGAVFIFVKGDLAVRNTARDRTARLWLAATTVCLVAYVVIFRLTPGGGPTGTSALGSLRSPLRLAEFVLLNLGSILVSVGDGLALAAGLFLLLVTALCVARALSAAGRRELAFPLALIGYELSFAVLAAMGRSPLGLGWSRDSHYTAYVPLLLVGNYLILIHGDRRADRLPGATAALRVAFGAFLAAFFAVSTTGGIVRGYDLRAQRGVSAAVLLDYRRTGTFKIQRLLFEDASMVVRLADFLKTRRFSTFSAGARAIPAGALAYVTPPDSWNELNSANPDMHEALQRLWDVYGAGRDLQVHFDPSSETFAHDLVQWAFGATREGGDHYLRQYLLPYAQEYATLRSRLAKP